MRLYYSHAKEKAFCVAERYEDFHLELCKSLCQRQVHQGVNWYFWKGLRFFWGNLVYTGEF